MRRLLPAIALVACTETGGPVAINNLDGDELFDMPWPSDSRRDEDGTISVRGFPNPDASAFIDSYLVLADSLDGFGNNGPVYVRFRGPLPVNRLPDPAESLEDGSPLALFAIAPGQPWDGERVPVRWHFQAEGNPFEPSNLLAASPVWGFPLRPHTTYGFVVSTEVARRPMSFEIPEPVLDALPRHGYGPEDVAIATAFTTQDPTAEMARLASFMRNNIDLPSLRQVLGTGPAGRFHDTFDGRVPGPNFQHGQRPWALSGGEFRFREDGQPIIAEWENLRIVVTTPRAQSQPPDGWPVLIYQHGTFTNAYGFASGNTANSVGATISRAGYVGIGIDQPLHGDRQGPGTDQQLHTFNYLNPSSARAIIRQGAADAIWLTELLTHEQVVFTRPNGSLFALDPDKVSFMGHSQGGLTGAIAAPWLGDRMDAMVLSGAGGGTAITVMERKDPQDISAAIKGLLRLDEDDLMHEQSPIIGLVQMLVDVTDPINYAPFWFSEERPWGGEDTASMLLFSGVLDEQTPGRSAEALAVAGRLSPLAPNLALSDGWALLGERPVDRLQDNGAGWNGPVTAAFSQWQGGNHFVVFQNPNARAIYEGFLSSALDGSPVAEPFEP